jgi:surface carbohydrate biosynthesis protein
MLVKNQFSTGKIRIPLVHIQTVTKLFLRSYSRLSIYIKKLSYEFSQLIFYAYSPPRARILILGNYEMDLLHPLCGNEKFITIRFYKDIYIFPSVLRQIILLVIKRKVRITGNIPLDLYYAALVGSIKPKLVITKNDNYHSMYNVARMADPIPFLFIQDANRYDFLEWGEHLLRNIYMPYYACFGLATKMTLEGMGATVGEYLPLGSIRNSHYIADHFDVGKNTISYDICLVCEPSPGWDDHHPGFEDAIGTIATFVTRLANKHGYRIIISGKGYADDRRRLKEVAWYKKYIEGDYEVTGRDHRFTTYSTIDSSELSIGFCSTALSEGLTRKNKVLFCNFTGNAIFDQPVHGIWQLNSRDYDAFENVVLQLLNMSALQYYRDSEELRCQTMNMSLEELPIEILRKIIKEKIQ